MYKRQEKSYALTLSRDVISEDDNILLIDDFIADGEAATGAIILLRMAHATVAGIGILIEKSFQPGRRKINEQGYEVYSLAPVSYTHLDVYKRQISSLCSKSATRAPFDAAVTAAISPDAPAPIIITSYIFFPLTDVF